MSYFHKPPVNVSLVVTEGILLLTQVVFLKKVLIFLK